MKEKTVFITGAGSGIGMALARRLDQSGWKVFAGIMGQEYDEISSRLSERVTVIPVNITELLQIEEAAEIVRKEVGKNGLGLLINNAAMTGAGGPVEFVDIEQFKHVMDVNFWGHLRVTQAFLPLLRQYGHARIIMVSSSSIYFTIPLGCSYPVSKEALGVISRHLRIELAPFGIEVTTLEPGGVNTAMARVTDEDSNAIWNAIPDHMRTEYRARFSSPGDGIQRGFKFIETDDFAEMVYKKIICARKLRPVYTLGKGVGVLPVMQRLLSKTAVEKISRRLFRVKMNKSGTG